MMNKRKLARQIFKNVPATRSNTQYEKQSNSSNNDEGDEDNNYNTEPDRE